MVFQTAEEAARELGRELRSRRKALGVSMTVAAQSAGMSRVTWHRLEKGESGVAWSFLLAAAEALDLDVRLVPRTVGAVASPAKPSRPSLQNWLPLRIQLDEFPGLQRLAWQLRGHVESLAPREAWELYERNRRHLDVGTLSSDEHDLIQALGRVFGELHVDV